MLNNPPEPNKDILETYSLLLGQQESSVSSKPEVKILVTGEAEKPPFAEVARVHGLITTEPAKFVPLIGVDPAQPTEFFYVRIVNAILPTPVFIDDEEAR